MTLAGVCMYICREGLHMYVCMCVSLLIQFIAKLIVINPLKPTVV
jgi:hypothetical protein